MPSLDFGVTFLREDSKIQPYKAVFTKYKFRSSLFKGLWGQGAKPFVAIRKSRNSLILTKNQEGKEKPSSGRF